MRTTAVSVATTLMLAVAAAPMHAQSDSGAAAVLNDAGIVVRFPRFVSPDSITREMPVGDLFSGYEWRVVLLARDQALLTALVVAPNDSLILHRYPTIASVYLAGDLRQCQRNDQVLECDRLARGLVRDVNGCIEVGISDSRWIVLALEADHPVVRLIVKRNREILWSADLPLAIHVP